MKGTTKLDGQLEVDHERGVIYFHLSRPEDLYRLGMVTVLRICNLPVIPEFPKLGSGPQNLLDITHMHGVSWRKPE